MLNVYNTSKLKVTCKDQSYVFPLSIYVVDQK